MKTVTISHRVTNCKDCPYRENVRDMNASWDQCSHPKFTAISAYGKHLWGAQEHFTKVPKECPIGLAGAT